MTSTSHKGPFEQKLPNATTTLNLNMKRLYMNYENNIGTKWLHGGDVKKTLD